MKLKFTRYLSTKATWRSLKDYTAKFLHLFDVHTGDSQWPMKMASFEQSNDHTNDYRVNTSILLYLHPPDTDLAEMLESELSIQRERHGTQPACPPTPALFYGLQSIF